MLKKFTSIEVRANLIDEIEENVQFLMKYGILDYSLLFSL